MKFKDQFTSNRNQKYNQIEHRIKTNNKTTSQNLQKSTNPTNLWNLTQWTNREPHDINEYHAIIQIAWEQCIRHAKTARLNKESWPK